MAILEAQGFKVIAVRDGQQAVETFLEFQLGITLFLSDVRMPVKVGIDAAREIFRIKPVPVLLASGYGEISSRLLESEREVFQFIQKPFKVEQLLASIDRVMVASYRNEGRVHVVTPWSLSNEDCE